MGEIIEAFGPDIETITLVRGTSGVFDVDVDGASIFSKHKVKRHPEPGEVLEKIRELTGVA